MTRVIDSFLLSAIWIRYFHIVGILLALAYAASIGPVSQYAMMTAHSNTFPRWCSDLYEPVYEMHHVPVLDDAMQAYCDWWDVPFWLSRRTLIASATMGGPLVLLDVEPAAAAERSEEERQLQAEEQMYFAELEINVAKFLAAKNSREAGEIRNQFLRTPFTDAVEKLAIHDHPHVSVQAAWKRYSRMIPRRSLSFGGSHATIDPRDLERFLGFLEGRAQVLVPQWWERALADPDRNLNKEENPSRRGWLATSEMAIASDDETATLEIFGDKVRIPAKSLKWIKEKSHEKILGVVKTDHHLVLLNYSRIAAESNLVCVDLDQSKELWRNVSWGAGGEQVPARTGPPSFHHVSIEINEKGVFVFGAMTNGYGMYVDGFSLKDGTPTVRFSTNNWMIDDSEDEE